MGNIWVNRLLSDAFADKPVAAKDSMEPDDAAFRNIIKKEIDRINARHTWHKENIEEKRSVT